jgi:hypothetical protein
MGSPLDLVNSEAFRKKLITRNLTPYAKAPNRPTPPFNTEYIQSDTSVQDSPDQLIDEPSFANKLYPLNKWGNEGGYQQAPDPVGNTNTKSNEGEYGFQDANILSEAEPESKNWRKINAFGNGSEQLYDSGEFVGNLETIDANGSTRYYNNQPYPNFNPSTYGPVSILLTPDPQGSNGLLSSDSYLARLGASRLRKGFEERIATGIVQQTTGRANAFNVRSGTDVLNLVTGRVPLIEPNYTITAPSNPILAATDFALRLAGSTIPTSTIPGSYFDASINSGQPTTIQQLSSAFLKTSVGKSFSRLLGGDKTGSQLFLNNTGGGQKSRLFGNIDYNKYKPDYQRTLFDRVGGALVGSTTDNSNFYVGSRTSDPSRVFSPGGDIPVNQFGQEVQSPVYGPNELAALYEGPDKESKLGANGPAYSNGGGVEGGFTWVSPKYKGNAGKYVGIGGEIIRQDEDFKPSSYEKTESTNQTYREGSILDDTQRLINSQPQGGRRLQHVGNAIDQVSKVFHDGYREITKGSRVLKYIGDIGQEVGTEYCRIFTKDVPYLQYNDLQKRNGMTTEGRKFAYSVMDKTWNLNIYPNKQEGGQDSTNLIGTTNNAYAKKYMFSIENLAWRTSNTPGFSVSDLAICERGPNGGRVMWFPPYGLQFSENVSANWKNNDFIGRPEPIYTYNNTNRTGSLTWKIVVDHPSVLNVLVDKVLKNETNRPRIDSIIDSFFAGCRTYDLYELAKKYYTINPNDLFQLQQMISSKEMTKEQMTYALKTIQPGNTGGQGQIVAENNPTNPFTNFVNMAFYFDNDIPKPKENVADYPAEFAAYSTNVLSGNYTKQKTAALTKSFFDSVVDPNYKELQKLCSLIKKEIENNKDSDGTITIKIDASCSAPATSAYNKELAKRRINAAIRYFSTNFETAQYYYNKKLLLVEGTVFGEEASVLQYDAQKKDFVKGTTVNCTDGDPQAKGGDTQAASKEIYTTTAMACRRAYISNITSTLTQPPAQQSQSVTQQQPQPQLSNVLVGTLTPVTTTVQTIEEKYVERDNITKRVLRSLLSECNYFEAIKEETPMVYDNLKDKLKFFQPAFHSMTPEGLNTRLTFLQQCMRPGDTIPTIKTVGQTNELQYNNATNTAFGAPPVLILRVGDFYNTKIIPTSLALTYEELDINPEGIGIQPMIANVTLAFNFVGGSGLKESVDRLQNALTFNYYANTEMYDDRADATDLSYKVIDKNFLNSIGAQPPAATVNQTQDNNPQTNESTIGDIISISGDKGTISYQKFMNNLVSQTQTYFQNYINKSKECVKQYNNAMLQNLTCDRNYVKGKLLVDTSKDVLLIGKPNNVQQVVNNVFTDYAANIESNDSNTQDRFINFMSNNKGFSEKVIRQLKTNLKNFVLNKTTTYQNAATQISQELVNQQQTYIQYLSRANVIPLEKTATSKIGTDGLQEKNGNVVIYDITGTEDVYNKTEAANTFIEIEKDIQKIGKNITEYYNILVTGTDFDFNATPYRGIGLYGDVAEQTTYEKYIKRVVFVPFTEGDFGQKITNSFKNPTGDGTPQNYAFRRMYMILSPEILDDKKYQTFKDAMISNIIKNKDILGSGSQDVATQFDSYWIGIAKPQFSKENAVTTAFLENLEKGKLKDFINYTPFTTKKRLFTFEKSTAPTASQTEVITGLGRVLANSDKQTWNNEDKTLAYVSKLKLN